MEKFHLLIGKVLQDAEKSKKTSDFWLKVVSRDHKESVTLKATNLFKFSGKNETEVMAKIQKKFTRKNIMC